MPVSSSIPPGVPAHGSGRTTFRWLVGAALACCFVHVILHLTWFGPQLVSKAIVVWTDVRNDMGPLTWVSVLAMLLAGIAALRLARDRNRDPERTEMRGWTMVGALFLYLAVDDALTIHEMINDWSRQFVGDEFSFPWTKVLLPILAVLGIVTFRFLVKALWNDQPRRLEMVAGYGCLGAAVGLEFVERWLLDSSWRPRGFPVVDYPVVLEEFLEALGPALLFLCFTRVRESTPPAGVVPMESTGPLDSPST